MPAITGPLNLGLFGLDITGHGEVRTSGCFSKILRFVQVRLEVHLIEVADLVTVSSFLQSLSKSIKHVSAERLLAWMSEDYIDVHRFFA